MAARSKPEIVFEIWKNTKEISRAIDELNERTNAESEDVFQSAKAVHIENILGGIINSTDSWISVVKDSLMTKEENEKLNAMIDDWWCSRNKKDEPRLEGEE